MKRSKKGGVEGRSKAGRTRAFRAGVIAFVLFGACAATAVAKYGSRGSEEPARAEQRNNSSSGVAPAQPAPGFVTVEVGGKRISVNAKTLQQGPLTQEQSQQIADALEGNKSTDGLVETRHADGTVSVDLEGRFQNVMMAQKNDDGSVSTACVDTPEAARSFLRREEATPSATNGGSGAGRKAAAKE
ncbi:MAG: post-PEP-CTERM-1 domain-containing protein [Pyrinomonadaceae bacterium]